MISILAVLLTIFSDLQQDKQWICPELWDTGDGV